MEHSMEQFLVYIQETKKQSENTTVSYRRDLRKLADYLSAKGIEKVADVTVTHLESYMLYLEQQGFAPASVSRMIASMKAYFKYLVKQGEITTDCAEKIKAPKVEHKEQELITRNEVFALLEQPPLDTEKGIRDRAMMELLYATGIRVSDVIALHVSDVNLKLGYVTCRNQTVSFGRETQKILAKYMTDAREGLLKKENTDLLFPNCSGGSMSRQGFWKLMKTYAKAAGIQKDITSNMIRKL